MRYQSVFGVITIGLVAAALAPATTAATAAPPTTKHDRMVTGRVLAGLTAASAAPVESTQVYLWWIPGLDSAQVGDELAIETLATATTDAEGRYAIDVAPTPALRRAAALNGGWVNFDIGTLNAEMDKTVVLGVSRRLVNGKWETRPGGPPATTPKSQARTGIDDESGWESAESSSAPTDMVLTEQSADVPPASGTSKSSRRTSAAAAAAGTAYCSFVVTGTPQRSVNVVEFHNASNSNANWVYGESADSNIEGGIDYSGDGGWGVGAAKEVSNSTSSTVGRSYTGGTKANNYGTSDFDFVDGYYKPYGAGSTCEGSSIPVNTKTKNPTKWVGGVGSNTGTGSEYIGCDQSPQSGNRTNYPVGSVFDRVSSSAAKISLAVDLGPITVGSKSGYSTSMDMHWDSKRGNGIWLCGTNSGVLTAGVIHAQNRP